MSHTTIDKECATKPPNRGRLRCAFIGARSNECHLSLSHVHRRFRIVHTIRTRSWQRMVYCALLSLFAHPVRIAAVPCVRWSCALNSDLVVKDTHNHGRECFASTPPAVYDSDTASSYHCGAHMQSRENRHNRATASFSVLSQAHIIIILRLSDSHCRSSDMQPRTMVYQSKVAIRAMAFRSYRPGLIPVARYSCASFTRSVSVID